MSVRFFLETPPFALRKGRMLCPFSTCHKVRIHQLFLHLKRLFGKGPNKARFGGSLGGPRLAKVGQFSTEEKVGEELVTL